VDIVVIERLLLEDLFVFPISQFLGAASKPKILKFVHELLFIQI